MLLDVAPGRFEGVIQQCEHPIQEAEGGKVVGVLPNFLGDREIAHPGLTELIMVESMHERKLLMHEKSDGIITLPGGFGTFEELFEMLTWGQLGLHRKPMGILNVDSFYDPLIELLDHSVEKEFLKQENRDMLLIDSDIESLLNKMRDYVPPAVPKWISLSTT